MIKKGEELTKYTDGALIPDLEKTDGGNVVEWTKEIREQIDGLDTGIQLQAKVTICARRAIEIYDCNEVGRDLMLHYYEKKRSFFYAGYLLKQNIT